MLLTLPKAFLFFLEILKEKISLASHTIKNYSKKLKPWLSNTVIRKISLKNKLYKLSKKHPNNRRLKKKYKKLCKSVAESVKIDKSNYYIKRFSDSKNNCRAQWRLVNELVGACGGAKSEIVKIISNNVTYDKSQDIANIMNSFFITAPIRIIDRSITDTDARISDSLHSNYVNKSLFLFPVTGLEVFRVINSLKNNKSKAFDGITTSCIKRISLNIVDILTVLINRCLALGIFPACLKLAIVIPVYKKGSKTDPNNYRPISLVSVFSKIFEKILKTRLEEFLNKINFFNRDQFGFTSGCSTEDAILTFINDVDHALNEGACVGAICLDLTKAFDTVSHDKLLDKLSETGVRGVALSIFQSFLSDRQQAVRLGDCLSDFGPLKHGVPQGTVLGPLLFIIYLNDLLNVKLAGRILAYADDLMLIYRGRSWFEVDNMMRSDLKIVRRWLNDNHLVLSSKSTAIRFHHTSLSSNSSITCHIPDCNFNCDEACIEIPFVEEITYLGMVVDSRLTWKPQLRKLTNSLAPAIAKAFQVGKYCPENVARSFYFACVESRLQYGITAWGAAFHSNWRSVEMAQRTALRALFRKRKFDSLFKTFIKYRILPITLSFKFKTLRTFFIRGGYLSSRRIRSLRLGPSIPVPQPKTEWFKRTFVYLAPTLFNSLPDSMKSPTLTRGEFLKSLSALLWREYISTRLPVTDLDLLFRAL